MLKFGSAIMKQSKYKIISISGNARSGKDTLGNNMVKILEKQGIKAKTVSFANELKSSVDEFLISKLGISAFTEKDEEKKIIRPFLVFWGTEMMRSIDKSCWINKLKSNLSDDCVNIITDARFENEINWVKDNDGLTVFLSRDGVEPANPYEEEENKKIKDVVDLTFHMGNFEDDNIIYLTSNEILDKLLTETIFKSWKATCHS